MFYVQKPHQPPTSLYFLHLNRDRYQIVCIYAAIHRNVKAATSATVTAAVAAAVLPGSLLIEILLPLKNARITGVIYLSLTVKSIYMKITEPLFSVLLLQLLVYFDCTYNTHPLYTPAHIISTVKEPRLRPFNKVIIIIITI